MTGTKTRTGLEPDYNDDYGHRGINLISWGDSRSAQFRVMMMTSLISVRGGLTGYVKSKPLGPGQILSIDVLLIVMIIAVFHKKLI